MNGNDNTKNEASILMRYDNTIAWMDITLIESVRSRPPSSLTHPIEWKRRVSMKRLRDSLPPQRWSPLSSPVLQRAVQSLQYWKECLGVKRWVESRAAVSRSIPISMMAVEMRRLLRRYSPARSMNARLHSYH